MAGFVLAWLALSGLIASGGTLPAARIAQALAYSVIDCQAPLTNPVPDHHRHAPDGMGICPLAIAHTNLSLTPADPPLPAEPVAHYASNAAERPQARAPPARTRTRPPAQAPPVLA